MNLSDRTGLSVPLLSKVERGQRSPSISSLCKISIALKASVASFFDEW